jgi:hypothetical protein
MQTATQQSNAMRAGQAAWDHGVPDDPVPFLETPTGDSWLSQSVDTLLEGKDVKVSTTATIDAYKLSDRASQFTLERMDTGYNDDGWHGQMLVAIEAGDLGLARSCLQALIGKDAIAELAKEICTPYAEQAAEQLRKDECDDDYEGF